MQGDIEVRECLEADERELFWQRLREYFRRDIFPGEEDCYHCSEKYKENIETLHERRFDPVRYLFFRRDGQDIGLALSVVYASEDGKQFILEFCVFPEFRETARARPAPGRCWPGAGKTERNTLSSTAPTSGGSASGPASASQGTA